MNTHNSGLQGPRVSLEGRFRIEVRRNGIIVKEVPEFKNLITDLGLLKWFARNLTNSGLRATVGSSNQPPSVSDVQMVAPFAHKQSITQTANTKSSAAPFYTETTYKAVFPMNSIVGNIAEIGIFSVSTNPAWGITEGLFCRSLIKDAAGNPTVISVVANEEVTVFYSLRQYEDLSTFTGTFNVGSDTYNYTSHACTHPNFVGSSNGILESYFGHVSSHIQAESALAPQINQSSPYSKSGFPKMDGAATVSLNPSEPEKRVLTWGYDYNNNMGSSNDLPIKAFYFAFRGNNPRRVVVDPPIPKDVQKKLTFSAYMTAGRYP